MNEPGKFYRTFERIVPKFLRPLFLKYQEFFAYCFCGGIATIINGGIFYGLTLGFGANYLLTNLLAWFLSVVFAFLGNKSFVFEDEDWSPRTFWKQAAQFFAARLFSLGLEELLLFIFVGKLGFDQNIVKVCALAFVTISNYIFSKLLIFKKK